MKEFNTTGVCIPSKHYMVDLTDRVNRIRKMVDAGKYFTINRGRQYGKTTTLNALRLALADQYDVVSLDFQSLGHASYRTEADFTRSFAELILDEENYGLIRLPDSFREGLNDLLRRAKDECGLGNLFRTLRVWCKDARRPVVLMIDEVDSASNNQVFLDFLAQLREGYLSREAKGTPAFQSVILAGVTDIKHLRSKIRDEDQHKVNSPWNIAADYDIDMSLSEEGIRGMLEEYEADHHTGMDPGEIAKLIRDYTGGYPFLVSRICQLIDERLVPASFASLTEAWTSWGVDEAVKSILSENNTLFDSLMGKLRNQPELKDQLRRILLRGERVAWGADDDAQQLLYMYGFIRNNHNTVAIANRIFEMRLYNFFIGESERYEELKRHASADQSIFIEDGWLNVPKIMEHFIAEHNRIHSDRKHKSETEEQTEENRRRFIEEEGRERFLTYLSPIINGTGTYSVEEQTRDQRRMDVVIHYLGKRYIVELKIWRGERYNEEGEKQVLGYLDYFGLDTGYMLSFNFNREKEPGVHRTRIGDRVLFEGVV